MAIARVGGGHTSSRGALPSSTVRVERSRSTPASCRTACSESDSELSLEELLAGRGERNGVLEEGCRVREAAYNSQ